MKTIEILPSKSEAHRVIIASSLCEDPRSVELKETSNDIEATRNCMEEIQRSLNARASGKEIAADLYCGESGSTFRFLIPVVAALGIHGIFHPEGRLPERPLSPMYEELIAHGAALSPCGEVPFQVGGALQAGEYTIPGNVSSQYITGLLFALPLLPGDSTLRVTGEVQSKGYVDMTLRVLQNFGIVVNQESVEGDTLYRIPGNQQYGSSENLEVEGDWSNAAFWLAAGILGKEPLRVTGLNMSSPQGDRKIVDLIRQFGGKLEIHGNAVIAYPSGGELQGIEIDASQIPDMVPAVALIATQAAGTTEITHAERLRLKESDRLKSVTSVLSALGASIAERQDGLSIEGPAALQGACVSSYNDHRITMMAAVASLITDGKVTIIGAESVNKSYPTFFTIMNENAMSDNVERR